MQRRELKTPALRAISGAFGEAPPVAAWSLRYATCMTSRWIHGPVCGHVPPMSGNVIAVVFDANTPVYRTMRGERREGCASHGTITVVPEGEEGHWEIPGNVDGIQMIVSQGHLAGLAELAGRRRRDGILRPRLTEKDSSLFRLFEELSAQANVDRPDRELVVNEIFDRICMHLLTDGDPTSPKERHLSDVQVKRVQEHLRHHLNRDIAPDELAHLVGLDDVGFRSAFRRTTGSSVYQRLTYLRMMRAQELLTNRSRLTVSEIAGIVGYRSTSGFSRAYKQAFGIAPSWHRKPP